MLLPPPQPTISNMNNFELNIELRILKDVNDDKESSAYMKYKEIIKIMPISSVTRLKNLADEWDIIKEILEKKKIKILDSLDEFYIRTSIQEEWRLYKENKNNVNLNINNNNNNNNNAINGGVLLPTTSNNNNNNHNNNNVINGGAVSTILSNNNNNNKKEESSYDSTTTTPTTTISSSSVPSSSVPSSSAPTSSSKKKKKEPKKSKEFQARKDHRTKENDEFWRLYLEYVQFIYIINLHENSLCFLFFFLSYFLNWFENFII